MSKLQFKEWLLHEWANFGFDTAAVKPVGGTEPAEGAGPIDPIDSHIIIQELCRLPALGLLEPRWTWADVVEWGHEVGALKIDISPLGSYKIMARRKIRDLQGENTWICKGVFTLEENEHNRDELDLAHQIYDDLKKISMEMIEGPAKEYPDFERLVRSVYNGVRREYPSYCMFPVGTKKMDENYYKIIFEFRGHGVEAPTRARAEQFNIDIHWDSKRGLIHLWGYNIDSKVRQHSWQVMPSEFEEWFSPAQPIEEIVKATVDMLLTY